MARGWHNPIRVTLEGEVLSVWKDGEVHLQVGDVIAIVKFPIGAFMPAQGERISVTGSLELDGDQSFHGQSHDFIVTVENV
jgi:hypothetical protein